VLHLAEYGVDLAKAYAEDAGRAVRVQETGAPEPHIPAADAPHFARQTVLNASDCALGSDLVVLPSRLPTL
jgi:hypothetical protein